MSKDFNHLTNLATEFHFPTFEQQLESIKSEHLEPAISWRLDYISRNQSLFNHQEESVQRSLLNPPIDKLKCGDFYVTRHSNLQGVQNQIRT